MSLSDLKMSSILTKPASKETFSALMLSNKQNAKNKIKVCLRN